MVKKIAWKLPEGVGASMLVWGGVAAAARGSSTHLSPTVTICIFGFRQDTMKTMLESGSCNQQYLPKDCHPNWVNRSFNGVLPPNHMENV